MEPVNAQLTEAMQYLEELAAKLRALTPLGEAGELPQEPVLASVGTVTFFVPGIAQPKGSTKAFHRPGMRFPVVTSDNPKLKDWQTQVAHFAGMAFRTRQDGSGGPFVGGVRVGATFYLKRPQSLFKRVTMHLRKPDVDKLARCLNDAMIGIAYVDDSQVVALSVEKVYAAGAVGVQVTVSEVRG